MKSILFTVFTLTSSLAFASTDTIIKNLTPFVGSIEAANVVTTDIPGVYEVITTDPIESIYVSQDGRYIFQGDVIDLSARAIKEKSPRVKELITAELGSIKDEDMIIFKADKEQHQITVFTDVDCPFCARLHAQVPQLNKQGVTVKYAASPLEQLHPNALTQMEKIWCAPNRAEALDEYKRQRIVPDSKACDNPVQDQLAIATKIGVNGTPSIFFEDGTNIAGFLPAAELVRRLAQ